MERIVLDPGTYNGTYKLVGEQVSFDFINTIAWKGTSREHEWLNKPENFVSWALATGLIKKHHSREFKTRLHNQLVKDLNEICKIREDLRNVLSPLAFGKKIPKDAIRKLNAMVQKAGSSRNISFNNHQWEWNNPISFADALNPVIWNAAHILTSLDHSRVKHCPSCDWLFYDTTRNGSRKWCDMEDCGSRDKSLRYYHSQKK